MLPMTCVEDSGMCDSPNYEWDQDIYMDLNMRKILCVVGVGRVGQPRFSRCNPIFSV